MLLWPGLKVIVSLADGTALHAITRLSLGALRLRAVEYQDARGQAVSVAGRVIVPVSAVLSVQVVS